MSEIKKLTRNFDFPSGIIIPVDKPYEWTSSDVVRKIKIPLLKLGFKGIKIGHAGTLDPLATGVLLICVGKCTKQADALQSEAKEYVTTIELGAVTPSYDLEHVVSERFPYEHITKEAVEEALKTFVGDQEQIPPIFSAKLINGKRAYEYAREGEVVEMRKANVTIYEMELLKFNLPYVTIRMKCSKGTYVRSIARDLGLMLGSGGYLTKLVRTNSGIYNVKDCYSLDNVLEILLEEK